MELRRPGAGRGTRTDGRYEPAEPRPPLPKVTGRSTRQFQRTIRLQEARRLLVSGSHTVTSVAHAVGYASASHFSRDYTDAYGEAPGRNTRH
ncbi:helix-turn-helix transcriptional regulator [uncultured Amnibacterium sp.]|uniref:helix-turn-helix transcriptional regulator n=1 Tax=uncultured Amnibacterium sp. TaxID=1631851 RepID=UPI0035CA483F